MLTYGSVSSGIEAATQAWHPLGWSPAFFSEIARFPSQVLAHHYGSNMPGDELSTNGVPNLGDMTEFEGWPDYAIDLLVGGTPCQDYSIAGLRAGMDGVRGSLTLTYAAIARRYRPRWIVWENVCGVLSSKRGRDFASFLGLLSGQRIEVPVNGWRNAGVVPGYSRAYGLAWRVLDAQYVRVDGYGRAVPQRRRRVFVVGYLGDWRRAAAVLFEREGMSGNSAPRRKAQQVAAALTANGVGTCGPDDNQAQAGHFVAEVSRALTACSTATGRLDPNEQEFIAEVAPCLDANYGRLQGHDNQHIDGGGGLFVAGAICKDSFTGGAGGRPEGAAAGHFVPIAWSIMPQNSGKDYKARQVDVAQPLMAGGPVGGNQGGDYIQQQWAVRRLTPTECERLQGFPDGYTNIPVGKKMAADGPRYKALGNSMAINCMRWIGRRIEMVESLAEVVS
ncbi:DNA (cytosine-5-)-methyltransferase family protein [Ochrobactrum quorumnocens]|uniref:DNA (cytosine-5-)-methyltransferase n=1 Tax=Ochrobactrum quorumnocens TaxID=271865 RepID=A0A248UJV7_9HYPH|nr:DNA cytosine methyltransferase [[Ochrobactrum] quorumnocens]ASV86549.1 DNA (cytosine-5-)-methyltransferase family protein [[Ochrobactrum] quorumnocens]